MPGLTDEITTAQTSVLAALAEILPGPALLTGDAIEPRYKSDWSGIKIEEPLAVLRPQSVEQISAAMKICHAHGQPVSPQGGRTGLNGSAAPRQAEISLSMERFAGIEVFDPVQGTMLVRAGTTLAAIQAAALEKDWLMALDLGARGSCQIGGNISTNAGGNRVIRYGTTRDMVLGLEAVMADGTVLTDLSPMIKNNAGYNLKHLFIGSEGTLGIVTRAQLRLHPNPQARITALVSAPSFAAVTELLQRTGQGLGQGLSSFEVMWQSFYRFIAEQNFGGNAPMPLDRAVYVLIETHSSDEAQARELMEQFLGGALEAGVIDDAIIAQSGKDAANLWAIRDATGDLTQLMPGHMAFDVGIPIGRMNEFVDRCSARLEPVIGDNIQVYYGHLGDSNLHLNLDAAGAAPTLAEAHKRVNDVVYDEIQKFGGTITAEHGVGLLKKDYLSFCRSPAQIAAMRAVKHALDPKNILNPGRIFD